MFYLRWFSFTDHKNFANGFEMISEFCAVDAFVYLTIKLVDSYDNVFPFRDK